MMTTAESRPLLSDSDSPRDAAPACLTEIIGTISEVVHRRGLSETLSHRDDYAARLL
jgi:hypothetical protein